MTSSAPHVCRLFELPVNFDALVDDITRGLSGVYGEEGAALYRQQAHSIFGTYLISPNMRFWAIMSGEICHAVVLTNISSGRGEVSLAHLLAGGEDTGLVPALLKTALDDLKARDLAVILAEFLPTSITDFSAVFAQEDFACIPRMVLSVELEPVQREWEDSIALLTEANIPVAAECLLQAYAGDPGRILHMEVQAQHHAENFIARVLTGHLGATAPGMNLLLWRNGLCVGLILGCLLAPRLGFTLQVAVVPEARGTGVGKTLLDAQLALFAAAGCDAASLAVTRSNTAARAMYTARGYHALRNFDTYIWYREWPPGAREELNA